MNDGDVSYLEPGLAVPRILLAAMTGGEICMADTRGVSVVIVYPWTGRAGVPNPPNWDDTPGAHGSTPELEGFRELAGEFAGLNVGLFGLSRQTTNWQREMAARLRLTFPILSDAEGRFASALSLLSFATDGESYLKRLTLVISSGIIETLFFPVSDPASHAGDVLQWIREKAAGSA